MDRLTAIGAEFAPVEWLRDDGRHGGGVRFEGSGDLLNRASVNVSQVHYDDDPNKRLASASALSTIIHPSNPRAPSVHMHYSFTEMRDGKGYWRMMADLNPAIVFDEDRDAFLAMLRDCAGEHFDAGIAQGDRYFAIPALDRHRGVAHFYLEAYDSGDYDADRTLADRIGSAAIDRYVEIFDGAKSRTFDEDDRKSQLAYHTVYFFQVLTLDRGTTSGLLIHSQNDVGILGSLPSHVDGDLLSSWVPKMPKPQDELLSALIEVVGRGVSEVTVGKKAELAEALRRHYTKHPDALALQASGDVAVPTVKNHQ